MNTLLLIAAVTAFILFGVVACLLVGVLGDIEKAKYTIMSYKQEIYLKERQLTKYKEMVKRYNNEK